MQADDYRTAVASSSRSPTLAEPVDTTAQERDDAVDNKARQADEGIGRTEASEEEGEEKKSTTEILSTSSEDFLDESQEVSFQKAQSRPS